MRANKCFALVRLITDAVHVSILQSRPRLPCGGAQEEAVSASREWAQEEAAAASRRSCN